ncbi:MAG: tetratricopeptide repeat protein [Gemmatimonadales bacterium]
MNENPSRFAVFIAELRRRHVGRVAIAYAAVAFILLQAGEIVLPAFQAPEWGLRLMVLLILLGFPIAIALAWVYEITSKGIRRTPDLESSMASRGRPGRYLPRVAFLGLTFATVAAVGWWVIRWTVTEQTPVASAPAAVPVSAAAAPISSLAVLPLEDFSEEPGQEYFAAGLHEALVYELSRIETLRVVSRTTVARYAGTSLSMPEIAEELGVEGIVEGSVLRAGDRVRITVQLIHGDTDTHLWSSSYERELEDIIALQSEVAQAIAHEIRAELSPEQETRLAALTPVNPEAHEAYLRGRFEQAKGTPEGFESAMRLYQEAVEIDSTFAPAFAGLAASWLLLGMSDTAIVVDRLPEVIGAAQRAIVLDSASPEALAVLAGVQTRLGHVVDSLGNLKMTVSLDSLHAPNPEWLARHTEFGRQMEMVSVGQRQERAEPLAPERYVVTARRLTAAGEYETAADILQRALERYPSDTAAWSALEHVYVARGDYKSAVAVRRERVVHAEEEAGDAAEVAELERQVAELERAVAGRGGRGYWEWQLRLCEELEARGEPFSQVDYAAALVSLGDYDRAFERLALAYEARDPRLFSLRSEVVWDPVRTDPRFRDLLRRIRETRWPNTRPAPPR